MKNYGTSVIDENAQASWAKAQGEGQKEDKAGRGNGMKEGQEPTTLEKEPRKPREGKG